MEESQDIIQQYTDLEKEHTNIQLNYEYTESVLKNCNDSINSLNTKLSTFLGFAGLLLRFGFNLPLPVKCPQLDILGWECTICLLLKLSVLVLSAASICISAIGLTAQRNGTIVRPRKLMDDYWYKQPDERCRAFIINTWVVVTEELETLAIEKGDRLNLAIFCLSLAAVLFALDEGIATVVNVNS